MLAFNLLGVGFADGMSGGGKVAIVNACAVRVEGHQPTRLEHLLQLDKALIRTAPKYRGQNDPGQMSNGMP